MNNNHKYLVAEKVVVTIINQHSGTEFMLEGTIAQCNDDGTYNLISSMLHGGGIIQNVSEDKLFLDRRKR